MQVHQLPNELIHNIFSYLYSKDIASVCAINKWMDSKTSVAAFWKDFVDNYHFLETLKAPRKFVLTSTIGPEPHLLHYIPPFIYLVKPNQIPIFQCTFATFKTPSVEITISPIH